MNIVAALLYLLLVALSPCVALAAKPKDTRCENMLGWSDDVSKFYKIRDRWEPQHFSDPNMHAPKTFLYIVKTLRKTFSLEEVIKQIKDLPRSGISSASLISNEFTGLLSLSRWGVIIKVPAENIIATAPFDMNSGTQEGSSLDVQEMQKRFGFHTPEDLIKENLYGLNRADRSNVRNRRGTWMDDFSWNAGEWNEVKYYGSHANLLDSVSVIGLFRPESVVGLPDSELPKVDDMESVGEHLGLPTVVIESVNKR